MLGKKSNLTQKISNKIEHVTQNAQSELSLYTAKIYLDLCMHR